MKVQTAKNHKPLVNRASKNLEVATTHKTKLLLLAG